MAIMQMYASTVEETAVMCTRYTRNDTEATLSWAQPLNYSIERSNVSSLWVTKPTTMGVIIYSVVIPIVTTLGMIGNALILAVLGKKSLKASTFTYLAVLAAADLVTCPLLLLSGLARGIFWCRTGWLEFDAFVHLPVGSISSNVAVWATVCVTVDRLAIVWSLRRCKPPKFCDQQVARKLMTFAGFFAALINLPYCFIYTYNQRGELITTEFFHSRWYNLQNWLQFLMFGLLPAAFLLVANGIMCQSVRKTLRRRQLLLRRKNTFEGNRLRDQARLTIMLVGIVLVFLVGELPTHLASRRSAVSLLYGGDPTRVRENFMERFRMYATLLNAIASSANFILYCLLSRHFVCQLKDLFRGKTVGEDGKIKEGVACPRLEI